MRKITIEITYEPLTTDMGAAELLEMEVKENFEQITASLRNQAGNVKGNIKFQNVE